MFKRIVILSCMAISGCQTGAGALILRGGEFRQQPGPKPEYWTHEEFATLVMLSAVGLVVIGLGKHYDRR